MLRNPCLRRTGTTAQIDRTTHFHKPMLAVPLEDHFGQASNARCLKHVA
jgi:hypothetical protein